MSPNKVQIAHEAVVRLVRADGPLPKDDDGPSVYFGADCSGDIILAAENGVVTRRRSISGVIIGDSTPRSISYGADDDVRAVHAVEIFADVLETTWERLTGSGHVFGPPPNTNVARGLFPVDDSFDFSSVVDAAPIKVHSATRNFIVNGGHEVGAGQIAVELFTIEAEVSVLAVALLARNDRALDVDAPSVSVSTAAIIVVLAVVFVLTAISEVSALALTTTSSVTSMTEAVLHGGRHDTDIGAGVELVFLTPLQGLTNESDGAIVASQIWAQRDDVRLSLDLLGALEETGRS